MKKKGPSPGVQKKPAGGNTGLGMFFRSGNRNDGTAGPEKSSLILVRKEIIGGINKRRMGLSGLIFIICLVLQFPVQSSVFAGLLMLHAILTPFYTQKRKVNHAFYLIVCVVDIVILSITYGFANSDITKGWIIFMFYFPLMLTVIPLLDSRMSVANGLVASSGYFLACLLTGTMMDSLHIIGGFMLLSSTFGNHSLSKTLRTGFDHTIAYYRNIKARRDALTRLTNEKAEFLANINHELRTPLNGILGMTTLLMDSPLTEEQKDYALTIRNSSELLLSLINDILDMSRIEAGYLRLEKRSFNFIQTINLVVDNLKPAARSKHIGLEIKYQSKIPKNVIGDASRLGQILFNLVGNAVKFTSKGGVSIVIKARPNQDQLSRCDFLISVVDSGIGISADALEGIFDKYKQASADIQKQFGGTGLGLAISMELTQRMGGEIRVESKVGSGSTFTVAIPMVCEEPVQFWKYPPRDISHGKNERQNESSAEGQGDWTGTQGRSSNTESGHLHSEGGQGLVYLVDDNAINLNLLSRMVAKTGLRSLTSNSSLHALEELKDLHRTGKVKTAIIDFQMPDLNGHELVSRLRAWEKAENLDPCPVFILTGHGAQSINRLFNEIAQVEIIEKPIRLEFLKEILKR